MFTYAMNHANVGARYIQVGSSAGPTSTITAAAIRNKLLTLVGQGMAGLTWLPGRPGG
jgi:hypothetical protein